MAFLLVFGGMGTFLVARGFTIPGLRVLRSARFVLVDQVDSMFGVMAVLAMLSPIGIVKYFGYIALGGVIHVLTNLGMIKAGIRKNL